MRGFNNDRSHVTSSVTTVVSPRRTGIDSHLRGDVVITNHEKRFERE